MSQPESNGILSRLGSAVRLMEGQAAESIERRLTTIERELRNINRRLAQVDDSSPQSGLNASKNLTPRPDGKDDQ